ncbi:MAG TPA: hypothetical protein VFS61_14640, partial [Anaerolineales bacterium]|nr:hypothetical protein [Anaerolineales bacterium]
IDLIAITDHNTSANVGAVQKAAHGTSLTVLPGMEVQSREEVHLLTLFETLQELEAWQKEVDASLPQLPNEPDFFGEQFVVDETGEFVRSEPRLLLNSTGFSIEEIFERVKALGGIVIPAHVERFSFGLFPTLGLISENWNLIALEISRQITHQKSRRCFRQPGTIPSSRAETFTALRIFSARRFSLLPRPHCWRSASHSTKSTDAMSASKRRNSP